MLIAGGGKLARQKLATLEPTGADVLVAAPWVDEQALDWHGRGRITLSARPYGSDLLTGKSLVFAATDDAALNHRIVAEARERGIPANAVDDPEHCDFITPSVVRRGEVTVAVSTGGGFPGFAKALREVLEVWLPARDSLLLRDLYALRDGLRRQLNPARRQKALKELILAVKRRYLQPQANQNQSGAESQPGIAAASSIPTASLTHMNQSENG